MGRAVKITRTDMSARDLRCASKRTSDGRVVRRLLAIALVLEGVDRATSARSSGMDRQTLRDWVHRYNAEGLNGLSDRCGRTYCAKDIGVLVALVGHLARARAFCSHW